MCNRYKAASVTYIRDKFGFTYIEEGPDLRGWRPGDLVTPWATGPFVTPRGAMLGQWGLIPDHSRDRRPKTAQGRPMSTNNLRIEKRTSRGVLGPVWKRGQRCLIPADDYDEPYYPDGVKNRWWRFRRADGQPWALAGVWSEWTDHDTGEVVPSYSMLTMNCDEHPLLSLMHKPERDPRDRNRVLPIEEQDKRSVIPIAQADWDTWLNGTVEQADSLLRLPAVEDFAHGAVDPAQDMRLPIRPAWGIADMRALPVYDLLVAGRQRGGMGQADAVVQYLHLHPDADAAAVAAELASAVAEFG